MMTSDSPRTAIVTGASSGIGAATVTALAESGFRVVAGARRLAVVEKITSEFPGAVALELDVTDQASVERFIAAAKDDSGIHLLVNNAGAAFGVDPVVEADIDRWRRMYEVNVLGVVRMTRAVVPALIASGNGHVINVGSIAGFESYPGGSGYTASKHALRAMTQTLRKELLGKPVRVTEIAPGMVETEFSVVRFGGDEQRADAVYDGMEPLVAADIADCIAWAASRPPHVNIDEIVVRPRDQATATMVHRRNG